MELEMPPQLFAAELAMDRHATEIHGRPLFWAIAGHRHKVQSELALAW